jgi:hypothetical protein
MWSRRAHPSSTESGTTPLETDQFGCEGREPLDFPLRPSVLQEEVLSLYVTQLLQPLFERIDDSQDLRAGRGLAEPSYPDNFSRLLRLDGEWCSHDAKDDVAEKSATIHHDRTVLHLSSI